MLICKIRKDGGPKSKVTGYWLIEIKSLFSIVLLRFDPGTRDADHSHAFNSVSWLLRGMLIEIVKGPPGIRRVIGYAPSLRPIMTYRTTNHRVCSVGTSWVLSFRGPWSKTWEDSEEGTLTHGRQRV